MKFFFFSHLLMCVWDFLHVANFNRGFSHLKFHSRVEKELFKSKNAKYSQIISRKDIDEDVNMQEARLQGNVIQNNYRNGTLSVSIQKTAHQNKTDKTKSRKVNLVRGDQSDGSRKLLSRYSINKNLCEKRKLN